MNYENEVTLGLSCISITILSNFLPSEHRSAYDSILICHVVYRLPNSFVYLNLIYHKVMIAACELKDYRLVFVSVLCIHSLESSFVSYSCIFYVQASPTSKSRITKLRKGDKIRFLKLYREKFFIKFYIYLNNLHYANLRTVHIQQTTRCNIKLP